MISTSYNDNVPEAHWIAELNNGVLVYQDDLRNDPKSAWLRLKDYCLKEKLWVESIRLKFRSHEEIIHGAEGYWLRLSLAGVWGVERSFNQIAVGKLQGDQVHIDYWLIPELIIMDSAIRDKDKCEEHLIDSLSIKLLRQEGNSGPISS